MKSLTEEEVLGPGCVKESEHGTRALQDYRSAEEALAKGDAAELFILYQKAIVDRNEVFGAMQTLLAHMLGQQQTPRYQAESPSAIEAIRSVALETISFAREVVRQSNPSTTA